MSRWRRVQPNDSPRSIDLGNALLIIAIGAMIMILGVAIANG